MIYIIGIAIALVMVTIGFILNPVYSQLDKNTDIDNTIEMTRKTIEELEQQEGNATTENEERTFQDLSNLFRELLDTLEQKQRNEAGTQTGTNQTSIGERDDKSVICAKEIFSDDPICQ